MSKIDTELTDHEAELYDRQIRLWGIGAQKRLRSAKVLIIGLQGLGCEVTKNVILAGIKSITLLDHGVLDINDGSSQFLAPLDKIGMNRAEASVERCQQLNPMVYVTADKSHVSDKPDSFFSEFDVVFASNCPLKMLIHVNNVCRQENIPFFCGQVFGMFGYTFRDLSHYEYTEERNAKNQEEPKQFICKKVTPFSTLKEALSVNWKTLPNYKRAQKMDPSYFFTKVLLRFREKTGHDPHPATREHDLKLIQQLCRKELTRLKLPVDKIPDELILQTILEISPTCAVLGGVVGWEIIKVLCHRGAPLDNFFFWNPVECLGFSESIGHRSPDTKSIDHRSPTTIDHHSSVTKIGRSRPDIKDDQITPTPIIPHNGAGTTIVTLATNSKH